MTPEQIAEGRRVCEAATDGPWSLGGTFDPLTAERSTSIWGPLKRPGDQSGTWVARYIRIPDGKFATHARTAYPAALDDNERLEAEAVAQRERENARKAMLVSRLGGEVEGEPTQGINYLQRVDELRAIEKENERLRKKAEQYRRKLCREFGLDPDEIVPKHTREGEASQ